ncbi:MAG: hypothetical protein J2O49_05960, partial [Sciscionella sp.]|nr:hypothetical protein [Sciscionella sp.]
MQRVTTGRRRARAGALTVSELIDQHPTVGQAGLSMPRIPVSHARPPSTFAQVSKVAGLGTGVLVLCGAVYTASTIGQHNTEQQAAAAQQPLISGADALRPESVSAELADVAQQSAIGTVSPAGVGSSSQQ